MMSPDENDKLVSEETESSTVRSPLGIRVGNMGKPIRLKDVKLMGVSAEAAKGSEQLKVWTRLTLTSDDQLFHRVTSNLASVIEHQAQQENIHVRISRAELVLLVIKPDHSAELWIDAAAVAHKCMVKRSMAAGSVVFENDIADVIGMYFPCVEITRNDKVLCLFRQDWRFALYFDFNPDGNLNLDAFATTLGTLYRTLKYRRLYDALTDEGTFSRLVGAGWFPFVEIIGNEFKDLADCSEAGFDLTDDETALLAKFDEARLDRIFDRWIAKPHFSAKALLLKTAISAFKAREPVSVLKILLTEIEGIINDAYKRVHGKGAKLKELLTFAVESAERKAGRPDTLLFSAAFAKYLASYTFANFDPTLQVGAAGSRHAVGHGAANADTYTMPRALQAILTLDQIAFYT